MGIPPTAPGPGTSVTKPVGCGAAKELPRIGATATTHLWGEQLRICGKAATHLRGEQLRIDGDSGCNFPQSRADHMAGGPGWETVHMVGAILPSEDLPGPAGTILRRARERAEEA
ncbi:unnamed protein product [Lampetra planeri]